MQESDVLIRGGTLYDGTGAPARRADVAIADGRISAVGDLAGASAARRIDASGLAVAPGFIDAHSHSDLPSLLAPLAESRLFAGVTTEICGNCGYAAGPFPGKGGQQFFEHFEGLDITWRTQGEFFDVLEEAGSAVNHAFLAGHGNIRRTAMGGDFNRPADAGETKRMQRLLAAEIEAGAIGMSTGLIYPPGCFAAKEEIAEVARVLAEGPLVYATHMRSEADALMKSLDESLFIAESAGCPLHVSHLKIREPENWHKIDELREWWRLRSSRAVRITADCYPYTASHTLLDSILPWWVYEGGPADELRKLESDDQWQRISREILKRCGEGEFWELTMVSTTYAPGNARFQGRRLIDVARELSTSPVDAVRRLLITDKARTMAVFFRMSKDVMLEILAWPDVVVGSDSAVRGAAGATRRGHPHPRTYGTTGRIFRLAVREKGVLSMEEAVHRLSGGVAEIFGLEKRGFVREGFAADVIVFDPAQIADRATYEEPSQFSVGVAYLFVNGVAVLEDGNVTGEKPGRVLRHGR